MPKSTPDNTAPRNAPKAKTPRKNFSMRLPPSVDELLTRKAKAAGLSESAYIRALIEGADLVAPQDAKLRLELNLQLSRIGNNLNQLAHHANCYRGSANAEALLRGIEAIRRDLSATFPMGAPDKRRAHGC